MAKKDTNAVTSIISNGDIDEAIVVQISCGNPRWLRSTSSRIECLIGEGAIAISETNTDTVESSITNDDILMFVSIEIGYAACCGLESKVASVCPIR